MLTTLAFDDERFVSLIPDSRGSEEDDIEIIIAPKVDCLSLSHKITRTAGFYILLSANEEGIIEAYVGKTDVNFKSRLNDHFYSKDYWDMVFMFTTRLVELTKADTYHLEGLMVAELAGWTNAHLNNKEPTGHTGYPDARKPLMRKYVASMVEALGMYGYKESLLHIVRPAPKIAETESLFPNGVHYSYEDLRAWRKIEAAEFGWSRMVYLVINDKSLKILMDAYPQNENDFGKCVEGTKISKVFYDKHGKSLLTYLHELSLKQTEEDPHVITADESPLPF